MHWLFKIEKKNLEASIRQQVAISPKIDSARVLLEKKFQCKIFVVGGAD